MELPNSKMAELKGEVAITGLDSSVLRSVAEQIKVPSRYFPVSLMLAFPGSRGGKTELDVHIFAEQRQLEGGPGGTTRRFVKEEDGPLPVYKFSGRMSLEDVFSLFRHFNMSVQSALLEGRAIEIIGPGPDA